MTDTQAKKKTFIGVLRQFGFKRVKWESCPKGFKEAGYPCYTHSDYNVWAEVYPKERYMLLQDEQLCKGHYFGKHFDEPDELYKYMVKFYNPSNKQS